MNNLMIFENKELGMDVRAIKNKDGSISINAEDTARGFGFTQIKNKKEYVRWETLNTYCKEFGFSQQVGKDDFIPESLFYLLGMKANNDVARKFQTWLAIDVIPAVRKTGQYKTQNKELLSSIDMFELQVKALREVEEKVNEVDKKFDDLPLFEIDSKDLKRKLIEL